MDSEYNDGNGGIVEARSVAGVIVDGAWERRIGRWRARRQE